jgi:hypothetical protein
MAYKLRVELRAGDRELVEATIREALERHGQDASWEVVVIEDGLRPQSWEAVVAGPRVDAADDWQRMAATAPSTPSAQMYYTRRFEGQAEQTPGYIRKAFEELLRGRLSN